MSTAFPAIRASLTLPDERSARRLADLLTESFDGDEIAVAAYGNMLLMGEQDTTLPVTTDDIESLLELQVAQVQSESLP